MKKNKKKLSLVAVTVLILVCGFAITKILSNSKNINIKNYIQSTLSGPNGHGTMKLEIDSSSLITDDMKEKIS